MADLISKSELKARMSEIFRKIEASGEELMVTDRGKPVLCIVPIREEVSASQLFAGLQGQVQYCVDVNTPTMGKWNETV
jgi:antitoxin (DNA-binding transcriptional repressor) of toxin-antitoxin stability system